MTESHVCSLKTASLLSLHIMYLPSWFSSNWIIQCCEIFLELFEIRAHEWWFKVLWSASGVLEHLSSFVCRWWRAQRSYTLSCKVRLKEIQTRMVIRSGLLVHLTHHCQVVLCWFLEIEESRAPPLPCPHHLPEGFISRQYVGYGHWIFNFPNHYPTDKPVQLLDGFCVLRKEILWQCFLAGIAALRLML